MPLRENFFGLLKFMQLLIKTTATNSTYRKVAVQWLNQALCFYQSFCLIDSFVLRNPPLRQAPKRYHTFKKPS